MIIGYSTDIGLVRERNEDAYYVGKNVFAIADGMGGHKAGEIASFIAVDAVSKLPEDTDAVPGCIESCFKSANEKILEVSKTFESTKGMGTTLTMAFIEDMTAFVGHVGDSRAYLLSSDEIKRLTSDHSVVAELVRSGFISEDDAKTHPQRNAIIRSLGNDKDVKVDILEVPVKVGDYLILCTDGLHNMLDDEEIKNIVVASDSPQSACDRLTDFAKLRGGHDNISTVIVYFDAENTPVEETRISACDFEDDQVEEAFERDDEADNS